MDKKRIIFSKTGTAVWISHLDLMHTIQRAFSRAGIGIQYSNGFNPHPQMSIALPLNVGVESVCEILDISLLNDASAELLNSVLPSGIKVLDIYDAEKPISDIKWLEISGQFNDINSSELNEFFSLPEIYFNKKSKRGISNVDIIPMIKSISFSDSGMNAVISAQNPTLNPFNIIDAVAQNRPELTPEYSKFKRVSVYDLEMNIFR